MKKQVFHESIDSRGQTGRSRHPTLSERGHMSSLLGTRFSNLLNKFQSIEHPRVDRGGTLKDPVIL